MNSHLSGIPKWKSQERQEDMQDLKGETFEFLKLCLFRSKLKQVTGELVDAERLSTFLLEEQTFIISIIIILCH